jgi:5-bromo-4-chloroindolyl phosphate hydrolysis protein
MKIIETICLLFSFFGAMFFGNLQGKKTEKNKQKLQEKDNEIENLEKIIEVNNTVASTSDIDRIKFMFDKTQVDK